VRAAFLGIPTLLPAGRKKDSSIAIENQTFGAGVTKNILNESLSM